MNPIQGYIAAAVAVVLLALGGVIWWEHHAITGLRAQVSTLTEQKGQCEAVNVNWKAAADTQNGKIAALKAAVAKRDALVAKATASATAARAATDRSAALILAQPVDKDDCKGALQVMQTFVGAKP